MNKAKSGAPWGGVPIREEVELASFPSPLSLLPIPTLSPRAVPPPPPPPPLLPWGSRMREGKKFKSVELGVGLEENRRDSGEEFPWLSEPSCSLVLCSGLGWPWLRSLFWWAACPTWPCREAEGEKGARDRHSWGLCSPLPLSLPHAGCHRCSQNFS